MTMFFKVRGRGEFPLDMLRRDEAVPADVASADAIAANYSNDGDTGVRTVSLEAGVGTPTLARWRSFGWPVVDDVEEDWRRDVWTITIEVEKVARESYKPSSKATVGIGIERLDPDGPIHGSIGSAVSDLAAQMPDLKGLEPYLANGILGVFACMVARIEKKLDQGFNDATSRVAWMPGYVITITIV